MTNRLDRLEERGLVRRHHDALDARSFVFDNPAGRKCVDSALADLVESRTRITGVTGRGGTHTLCLRLL